MDATVVADTRIPDTGQAPTDLGLDMRVDVGVDMELDRDVVQDMELDQEMLQDMMPDMDQALGPCEHSKLVLPQIGEPPNEIIPEDTIYWTCVELPSGESIQMMSAELSIHQAQLIWRAQQGVCEGGRQPELCKDLNDFHGVDTDDGYRRWIRDEHSARFDFGIAESRLTEAVRDLPLNRIRPNHIQELISVMNAWGDGHPYEYRLPCYEVWEPLYREHHSDENQCERNETIKGVFQGDTILDDSNDRKDGCNFYRPRSVLTTSEEVHCYDELWRGQMHEMIVEVEDRSHVADPKLCDLYGNMREVLTNCPNNKPLCTLGEGWKEDAPNRDTNPDEIGVESRDDEIGFRFIRYLKSAPPPCPALPEELIPSP